MLKRINWVTATFLVATPSAALIWGGIHTYHHGVTAGEVAFFAIYLVMTGMSITAGYHRLFAHRAYETGRFVRALYLLFGAAAFQDSVVAWVTDHRSQHLWDTSIV